jgi:cyclopropane-fatty-acyl-phospholipid synthase
VKLLPLVERKLVPDSVVRYGIRRRVEQRLRRETERHGADPEGVVDRFAADLQARPIAERTDDANRQHYEVPAAFFTRVLGPHLKYSSGFWGPGVGDLAGAEEAMLALYAERARLADGQSILDLGCGWGSLSLWLAERYPQARILGVSNSTGQRRFILQRARDRKLANLDIVTHDMNGFETERRFDRVVSIEMFEHMKNYRQLLARIAGWLNPGGSLFVHIFTHARFAYHFETDDPGDWMARHFFAGGTMPSHGLLSRFQDDLELLEDWVVDGTHYRRTAEAWLANLDRERQALEPVLAETYGADGVGLWRTRWRLFFMACAEMFGYADGSEWQVSHYRFAKRR